MGAIISADYCARYPKDIKAAYLLSLPLYIKDPGLHTNFSRTHTDLYLNAYNFLMQNKKFTILNSQRLRKLLNINDGVDVTEETWDSFRLSLQHTIIDQNTYDNIKNSIVPIHIIYGSLDEFLVQESVDKMRDFSHVDIVKLAVVDHLLGKKFAKAVAREIVKED